MRKISKLLIATLFPTAAAGGEIDYSKIAEASSDRVESALVRYSRLYGEPCAYIQILNPGTWGVIETKRICELNGLSFESEVADAYFGKPAFSKNGIHLKLSITPLETIGEQRKDCLIPIKDKNIGEIDCIENNHN